MARFISLFKVFALLTALFFPVLGGAAEIDRFVGTYDGQSAEVVGTETQQRDVSTTISSTKDGFRVRWTSVIYKEDGRNKANSYEIEFVPSQRNHVFSSAMKTNVFGKQIALDPMKGEPFVWARLEDDTLSVFSLFISETGDYELQEFHRTLAEGGLDLVFRRVSHGQSEKRITAFLKRRD